MRRCTFADQTYNRQNASTRSNRRIIKAKRHQQITGKKKQQPEERKFKPTDNKQEISKRDTLTPFRFGCEPSNNTQEQNTKTVQSVFTFGTAKYHAQQGTKEDIRKEHQEEKQHRKKSVAPNHT